MKKKKNILIVILVIIGILIYISPIIMVVAGIFLDTVETKYEINNNIVSIDKGKITVDNVTSYYNEEDNSYYIIGYAHNNSKKNYSNLSLKYRMYDRNGVILGDSEAFLDEFKSNKVWKFKIIYSDIDSKDVDKIEFIGVNVY